MNQSGERVTLRRIAQEAGVSVATVSRALRHGTDIAEETRHRIEQLSQQHGYERRPRRAAARTPLVQLVVGDPATPWTMEVIRGAEHATHRYGARLLLSTDRGSRGRRPAVPGPPAGVIVDAPRLAPPAAYGRSPVVVVDPLGGAATDLPLVTAAAWSGIAEATQALLALGHRRIGVVAGPQRSMAGLQPLSGYRVALEAAGAPGDPSLIRWGDMRPESGLRETAALLDLPDPPTAVLVLGDWMALGSVQAVRRRGCDVPADVSIIALGDTPAARLCCPPLTTVRLPYAEMGAFAVRMIFEPSQPRRIELGGVVVHRASVAAPR